ncbi:MULTISPECIES: molybdenum ABC transporter ATP-binding protein [Roseovarius]|jgi:molybdate transport system ATP-binding protein|uniref:molybdenum ABC transporter ATP-binding protein n=1 Tax=Roseovarius TaxID=74030 RepID=UPI00273FC998|nr:MULTISPECIES: molybdenum ABC transporter ATP-binding protein [unclassified Roseovarius]
MSLSVEIWHRFPGLDLDVAFQAGAGVTALFGPSGAGKSSVVNAIAGLLRPDAGRVALADTVLFDGAQGVHLPAARRRIGYVFQDGRLFPHMSVGTNIEYGARFVPGGLDRTEMERVVALLGLEALLERRPGTLSGGEKQRVALARAWLSRPRLLLMDEPLAALDEPRKDEIFPYLERMRDVAQVPIVYVSHNLAEVARLADELVVMQRGQVVLSGRAEAVLSDPKALPLVGIREAGAILPARVAEHGPDGLSRLALSGGELLLPGVVAPEGSTIRLRVLAQDVLLSKAAPEGLSSHNVLPVAVMALHRGMGPGVAVQLCAGDDVFLARITQRAATEMGLEPGMTCFAILNATAIPRGSIGGAAGVSPG